MTATGPPRKRPGGRSARVRASVLDATIAELAEVGYAGLSTAAVADRAGVHRTTVHRRWPDRGSLVAEALLKRSAAEIPIPDTGSLSGDLSRLLRTIAATISEPAANALVRTLLADASASAEVREITGRIWGTRFGLAEPVFTRAIERGEMRDDVPAASVISVFVAPLYLRALLLNEPVDDDYIALVVLVGIEGLRPRS